MDYALRNNEALARLQCHATILKVDEKLAIQTEKELIIVVVFMPVIFALHYAKAYDRAIDLTQSLVVPAIADRGSQRRHVNDFQRRE